MEKGWQKQDKEQQKQQQCLQKLQQQPHLLVHIDQFGPIVTFDPKKDKEKELDLLTDAIDQEYKHRRVEAKEQIEQLKTQKNAFLSKCERLAQKIITIAAGIDSKNPLDKAYLIVESVVSTLQEQLKKKRQEKVEENFVLLRNQHT